MAQDIQHSRILGLIHCSRGALIFPLPIALVIQYTQPPMSTWLTRPYGILSMSALVLILEFYNAIQFFRNRVNSLLLPLITVILAIMVELLFPVSLHLIDDLILSIHTIFVIGLSVIETGLVFLK